MNSKARYDRVHIGDIVPRDESITSMNSRQYKSLLESVRQFGQLQPLVVEAVANIGKYRVVDGNVRLKILKELECKQVDVLDLGAVSEQDAAEIHLIFNMNRGKPKAEPLANVLEVATSNDVMRESRLFKEVPLTGKSVVHAIEKIRARIEKKQVKHDPDAEPSFIDFKMRLPPDAAKVCDQALSYIETNNDVKRPRAFELMAADYLAGVGVNL